MQARPIVKKVIWTLYGFESISGGYYRKDTPVPIPNTAVKLPRADNTWMATSRENRSLPDLYEEAHPEGVLFSYAEKSSLLPFTVFGEWEEG